LGSHILATPFRKFGRHVSYSLKEVDKTATMGLDRRNQEDCENVDLNNTSIFFILS
jgi:hypothetical protein